MTWTLLNSKSFQALPYAAAKALPYFFGKVKMPHNNPEKYSADFHFSYPEAKGYGFPSATFAKVIKMLIAFGFIDPIEKGGLRGYRTGYNVFRLSRRWEKFGTNDFETMDWETFMPKVKGNFKK